MQDRNILDIYKTYKIMPNLAMHMLRVASVASMICDNWEGKDKLKKDEIIQSALFHDMGNIIKIRLDHLPELLKDEGIEYWQEIKKEFILRYGNDEHKATLNILKELNINVGITNLINGVGHLYFCDQLNNDDMNIKILNYADTRVGPFGILSYEDRMTEVSLRYKQYGNFIGDEVHEKAVSCGRDIERQIFANCKIKPEDINDESAKGVIEELKNFVLR